MENKRYLFILIIIAIVAGIILWSSGGSRITDEAPYYLKDVLKQTAEVTIGSTTIMAEIASTPAARAKGLSGRNYIAPDRGMLFVFDKVGIYDFTMVNTHVPLDMVWIQETVITAIRQQAEPEEELISPGAQANYVLEVRGGTVRAAGWRVGDEVQITFDNK